MSCRGRAYQSHQFRDLLESDPRNKHHDTGMALRRLGSDHPRTEMLKQPVWERLPDSKSKNKRTR